MSSFQDHGSEPQMHSIETLKDMVSLHRIWPWLLVASMFAVCFQCRKYQTVRSHKWKDQTMKFRNDQTMKILCAAFVLRPWPVNSVWMPMQSSLLNRMLQKRWKRACQLGTHTLWWTPQARNKVFGQVQDDTWTTVDARWLKMHVYGSLIFFYVVCIV